MELTTFHGEGRGKEINQQLIKSFKKNFLIHLSRFSLGYIVLLSDFYFMPHAEYITSEINQMWFSGLHKKRVNEF